MYTKGQIKKRITVGFMCIVAVIVLSTVGFLWVSMYQVPHKTQMQLEIQYNELKLQNEQMIELLYVTQNQIQEIKNENTAIKNTLSNLKSIEEVIEIITGEWE